MTPDLKLYPRMKDSGVPWLGQVPEHWEILPAQAIYRPKFKKNIGMAEKTVLSLSYGRIIVKPAEKLHGLVPQSFETYQIVAPGDIIVRTTDLQNDRTSLRVGHSSSHGIITSAYMCLGTTDRVTNEFGYQFLNTYDLLKIIYGYGSGLRQNLDFRDMKRMPVLCPSTPEQAAIVRYLGYVDRRVRTYIRAKQKLIKLLEEQKQAIIHRAVTGQIDVRTGRPYPAYKPSGIAWLGEIPEGWEVRTLGRIAMSFRTGPFGSTLHQSDYVDGGIPLVNPTHLDGGRIVQDTRCSVPPDVATRLSAYRLETDDLIFARRGELGRCALVRETEAGWLCGTGSIRVRIAYDGIEPEYLVQALQIPWVGEYLSLFSVGATMANLNTGILKGIPLILPPIKEQSHVREYVARTNGRVSRVLSTLHDEISLLREYRTRLIADVVTGKLDVREAASRLPEELEADEPEPVDETTADAAESADDGTAETATAGDDE